MRSATKENKDLAYRWMRDLKASGSAYVEGALRLAFRTAGAFSEDAEITSPLVDTLVVFSAGQPTDNSFPTHRPMEPADVLGHVSDWNGPHGLVIHTVCFVESEFLQNLASQNGGRCVQR